MGIALFLTAVRLALIEAGLATEFDRGFAQGLKRAIVTVAPEQAYPINIQATRLAAKKVGKIAAKAEDQTVKPNHH